jgi:hypothetical protein
LLLRANFAEQCTGNSVSECNAVLFQTNSGTATGRGFADFVFVPKPEYKADYPALIVELKWNKNACTALMQIKDKKYPSAILDYTGDILLIGINYDKNIKEHQCLIEKYEKD